MLEREAVKHVVCYNWMVEPLSPTINCPFGERSGVTDLLPERSF